MLTWREQHQQCELGADQALAGARHAGHGQVGHGVGRSVYSPETAAAAARATRDGLKSGHTNTHTHMTRLHHIWSDPSISERTINTPVLLCEAPDESLHAAVCNQVQRAFTFMVGVTDIGPFLCQEASDSSSYVQLRVSHQP